MKGVLQFLRYSLVSGQYKFNPTFHQVIPSEILDIFKLIIQDFKQIIVIGYSFGDEHINNIFLDWIMNNDSILVLVSPIKTKLPILFEKYESKIKIINYQTTEFLGMFTQIPLSEEKRM